MQIEWFFIKSLSKTINLHWVTMVAWGNEINNKTTVVMGDGKYVEIKDVFDRIQLAKKFHNLELVALLKENSSSPDIPD